ncbi:MAG: glycoside hydrolase family 130 protein [Candidatus Hodarchaeales archaeon]|jgi:predicted GH43/DUF377 family glycosyl hydrolase
MTNLDKTFDSLEDGTVEVLGTGDVTFKLHSYDGNPILKPHNLQQIWYEQGKLRQGAIFNGGATIFEDKVILVPRAQKEYQRGRFFDESLNITKFEFKNYISKVWILISEDGINFKRFNNGTIRGDGTEHKDFLYGIEDIRIIKLSNEYLLIGCGKVIPPFQGHSGLYGDRIAIYSTKDFKDIIYHGIVQDLDVRNTVIIPETISGKNYVFLRFGKKIHLDILEDGLDQLFFPSKHNGSWKKTYERRKNTILLKSGDFRHEKEKIGPSTPPIKTSKGWLCIYHAVGEISTPITQIYNLSRKIPRGYSINAVLLDLKDPTKVLCRTKYPIYIPSHPWELYGNMEYPIDVPAVIFPMGMIVKNNHLMLYCGAGDKYVVILSTNLSSLVNFLWKECKFDNNP